VKTYIVALGLDLRSFFARLRVSITDENGSGFSLQSLDASISLL